MFGRTGRTFMSASTARSLGQAKTGQSSSSSSRGDVRVVIPTGQKHVMADMVNARKKKEAYELMNWKKNILIIIES